MPRRRSRTDRSSPSNRVWTEWIIEAAWLVGLVAVPLVFNPRGWLSFYNDPKYFVLHAVALVIVTSWAWERAIYPGAVGYPRISDVRVWLGRRPERWAVAAVAILGITSVLSTLASPVKSVSLWGRDPTDLGYDLYSFLALLVIFLAVALRMRSEQQVKRVFFAYVGVGVAAGLYGLVQHFGWDPLGPGARGGSRVFASFGNPIHFGSFLVMTAILTPVFTALRLPGPKSFWLLAGALLLGVQLTVLWYTGSRGPWIGYAVGVLVFVVAGLIWTDRRCLARGVSIVLGGVVIAFIITQSPVYEQEEGSRGLADIGEVFAFDQPTAQSIGGRGIIWQSVLNVVVDRPWSTYGSTQTFLVWSLLGYGPEMFAYAYPLGVSIDESGTIAQHAHNYPLHILIELGLIGLILVIMVFLLALYASFKMLNTLQVSGGDGDMRAAAVIVGLLAALAGRGVEQMAGIARVGDLVPFWILLALLIAVLEMARERFPKGASKASYIPKQNVVRNLRVDSNAYIYLVVAVGISVAAIGLMYYKDVRTIQASASARQGFELIQDGMPDEALAKYERAVDLNPSVEAYHLAVNDLFRKAASKEESAGNAEVAIFGWRSALAAAQRYADRNPNAFNTQARIGQAQSRLVGLGQDEFIDHARDTYMGIARAQPSFANVQTTTGQGLIAIGDDSLGLTYIDKAISMESATKPNPRAWYLRGVALENLGTIDMAEVAYQTAIQRDPKSSYALDSHRRLVEVYEAQGYFDKSAEQQAIINEFE